MAIMGENQRPVRAAAAKSKITMRLGSNATKLLKNPFRNSDKPAKKSDRQELRQKIAETTEVKRRRYLIEKKDYFFPLLPEHNYITKIAAAQDALSEDERAEEVSIPYEQLTEQPKGIKANMKDYQLSGLSFLVFLYRNGLSGILGDEMGLGKTLQTISLMQWLKENEPAGREPRPFLIVCPLSVLGTWQSELKKWAPGLQAVRFHGVKEERERVKKIATGELDFYGHQTKARTKKLKKAQAKLRAKKGGYDTSSSSSEQDDDDSDYNDANSGNAPDVIITTYDTYKAEQSWFQRAYVWKYVVLDEGHMIKNEESQISRALQALKAEYRLLLSGTPLQNNLGELWALFHWLYPMIFTVNTKQLFLDSYDLTHGKYIASTLDDSRELLQLCMLRRMKRDVGLNLPPKTDVLLFVPLTPMQRFWYQRFITRAGQGLLDDVFKGAKTKEEGASAADDIKHELDEIAAAMEASNEDGSLIETTHHALLKDALAREEAEAKNDQRSSTWQKLQNLLMQLRKVCNHPYTVYDPATDVEFNQHLVHASGKFIVLEKIINELVIKQNKKVVIFSCFTTMLDLTEQLTNNMSEDGALFESVRIDGSVSSARRNLGMRLFQDPASNVKVFLLSTRAGGLGITLTAATEMIFLDADFNPQTTLQAEARSHRIGQTKPVTVYKLASQGTVEEQMLGRISKKLYLATKITESMRDIHTAPAKKAIRPGQNEDDLPAMTTNQLMQLMRRGTTALSRDQIDVSEMMSWDWETTIAKCKDQALDVNVKKDTIGTSIDAEEEERWLKELEKVETKIFEGKELARGKPKTKKELGREFAQEFNKSDRRIGKNVTVEVDGYMVNKESMLCKWGEAFPTMGDKDPRLAEPKKAKKAPIENQTYCQICLDGGDLALCDRCPRSYHVKCLSPQMRANLKATSMSWSCPQHECIDCSRKTAQCGGMLYRCRFCEAAHCEDCIDFDNTNLVGENLKEYRMLGFGHSDQAYYVECQKCLVHWAENPEDKQITLDMILEFDEDYEKFLAKQNRDVVKASKQAADQAKNLAQALPFAESVPAACGESLSSGYDSVREHTPGVLTPADVTLAQNNRGKKAVAAKPIAKSAAKPPKRAAPISSLGGAVAKKARVSSIIDLISDSE